MFWSKKIVTILTFTLALQPLYNTTQAGSGSYFPTAHAAGAGDDDYDRLDGRGESGKKVDVIEWAGNLEIHVYPKGSLAGLALKLDKKNKNKPVMVIGYRFNNNPKKQLVRRAILGIELNDSFQAYKDPNAEDYDKIIITNHKLSGGLALYTLDPQPTQDYPDGHPALNKQVAQKEEPNPTLKRSPAQEGPDENGKLQHFEW